MSWFSFFSKPSAAAEILEAETARAAVAMGRIADRLEAVADSGDGQSPALPTVADDAPPVETVNRIGTKLNGKAKTKGE